MCLQIAILKVLVSHPEGRATIGALNSDLSILYTSGSDWIDRLRRLAARAPGLDIFGLVKGWFCARVPDGKAAVCKLPQIESTNVVFARRPLKRDEMEMLRLRRGQVVECSVSNDTVQSGFSELSR